MQLPLVATSNTFRTSRMRTILILGGGSAAAGAANTFNELLPALQHALGSATSYRIILVERNSHHNNCESRCVEGKNQ